MLKVNIKLVPVNKPKTKSENKEQIPFSDANIVSCSTVDAYSFRYLCQKLDSVVNQNN